MENQKEIRLAKAITVNVKVKDASGERVETHELQAGRQKVPAYVADNWFVKANLDKDDGSADSSTDSSDARIAELTAQLQAVTAERDDLAKKVNDLQATIDLSGPADKADPKSAGRKG